MSEGTQRRLTTIVAADIAGFSRLVGLDEEATLVVQRSHRTELIEPLLAEHHGRIANTAGDSFLFEFPSAVEAVRFALAVQAGMTERNRDIETDRRIEYRIGINVGDVVAEGNDLLGDGVNVAARLEGIADPGEICMSRMVRDSIRDRLDIDLEDMGEVEVKNIVRPVRVFRVLRGNEITSAPAGRVSAKRVRFVVAAVLLLGLLVLGGGLWWSPQPSKMPSKDPLITSAASSQKPSIAVLPFVNISEDGKQEYFADGMTEDLITDLSKILSLTVISRTSSAGYKGRKIDVREIGKALGVRYVVEGSVRKLGEQVRINVQLIDTTTGGHIWAERYDGDLLSLFDLQDRMLEKIVSSLAISLSGQERRRLATKGTKSIAAHDLYLRGIFEESKFTRESNKEATRLYEQALSIDPDYPLPYSRLSNILQYVARSGWSDNVNADLDAAVRLARKAVVLDEQNPKLHWILSRAMARIHKPGMLKEGIKSMERAIELDPEFADAYAFLGQLYAGGGRTEDGLRAIKTAMRMNPRYPFWYLFVRACNHLVSGNNEMAIADLERAAERSPTAQFLRWMLAAAYVEAGRQDDAEWQVDELRAMGFTGNIRTITDTQPLQHPPFLKRYRSALRKAGIPD